MVRSIPCFRRAAVCTKLLSLGALLVLCNNVEPGPFTHSIPSITFTAGPREGSPNLRVTFTATDTSDADSWLWQFGDGDTSQERNPAHFYDSAGIYPVVATASNGSGVDACTLAAYVAHDFIGAARSDHGTMTVFYPNGGESFAPGDTVTVRMGLMPGYDSLSTLGGMLKLGLYGGLRNEMITTSARIQFSSSTPSFRWVVADSIGEVDGSGNLYLIPLRDSAALMGVYFYGRESDLLLSDWSDGTFSIR